MSFPTLETPRLRLRELTLDDAPALLAHLRATALDTLAIDQPKYAHEL